MTPLLTKIVATLGPATADPETIRELITIGVRVFRLNFSHGTFDEHSQLLAAVRSVAAEASVPVAVMGDLSGPKIRVGEVVDAGVTLQPGAPVAFVAHAVVATRPEAGPDEGVIFSTSYPDLVHEVQPGQTILLDDGKVRLRCLGKAGEGAQLRLLCEVTHGGVVTSRKGVNLPETELSLPALTEKDHACARYAVENELEYLALSFVRSPEDVMALRTLLTELEDQLQAADRPREGEQDPWAEIRRMPIISKIEKPQAVQRIEEIVAVSDAIMVARGDLGVEMDLAEVPVVQKRIIDRCVATGKPVIVATQMLESMIESPTPTRAETSDVANAILDGADAVMLSGETSIGKWPLRAAEVMSRVARRTNEHLLQQPFVSHIPRQVQDRWRQPLAMAEGVGVMAPRIDARMLVVWASADGTALWLSRNKASRPILLLGEDERLLRRAALLHGVNPICLQRPASPAALVTTVDALVLERRWAERGDVLLFLLPLTLEPGTPLNALYVHHLGE